MKRYPFLATGLLLCTLWATTGCEKESMTDGQGVIIDLHPLWTYELHHDGPQSNSSVVPNLIWNGNPILPTTDGPEHNALTMVDIQSGQALWSWHDIFDTFGYKVHVPFCYVNDNGLMWYQVGSRSYTIDLNDGSTKRKQWFHDSFDSRVRGLGNKVYVHGPPLDIYQGYRINVAFAADILEGQLERQAVPPFSLDHVWPDGRIGGVAWTIPIMQGPDTFLLMTYGTVYPNWYSRDFMALYDCKNRDWVYHTMPFGEIQQSAAQGNGPIIRDGKVYINMNNFIHCHDVWTGEKVWSRSFTGDFQFSGIIVEEGKVVANCENGRLYGLDALSGQTLWESEGAGTSTLLEGRYHAGIVYFAGGSTGRIHAVEVATGRTVWRLDPDRIQKGAERFKSEIYVVPDDRQGKAKVVVLTFDRAYCFEAYR